VINFPHDNTPQHPTSLSFIAQAAGLTLASLEPNVGGVWFTADIRNDLTDVTGNVAAVPEPADWMMLVAGLLVVGFITGRRAHNVPPA
jgi:hypothetical protein